MDQVRAPGPDELRRALREQAGLDLAALAPADGGESASTFVATVRDGAVSVLKVSPGVTGDSVARLRDLTAGLRRRGYPAARLLSSRQAAGMTFWLQERLPGTVLGRAPGWLLPEVLRLNEAQAGLGDGRCRLSGLIAATLTAGGDGYCGHATPEARPRTRAHQQGRARCLPRAYDAQAGRLVPAPLPRDARHRAPPAPGPAGGGWPGQALLRRVP